MPRKKRPTLASLKAEVWAELQEGRNIIETDLSSSGHDKYYGLCVNDDVVYVNPQPSIVETVLHELIHRTHPKMTERTVARLALTIMHRMSPAEVRRWMKQYKAVAIKRRKPLNVDAA